MNPNCLWQNEMFSRGYRKAPISITSLPEEFARVRNNNGPPGKEPVARKSDPVSGFLYKVQVPTPGRLVLPQPHRCAASQ